MGDKISQDELHAIFGPDIPLVAVKLLFPEKSEPLTTQELRQVLRALPAAPAEDVRAVTVAQAAQVLLDLLNMRGGHHEGMTREDAQKLWDAASDKHGYAAVSGFLSALIPEAKP